MSEPIGERFGRGEEQILEGRRGLGFSWAAVVRPAAPWANPARGGLFIAPAQPPPCFFLFFSGAALARLSNSLPAAPLKNKKNGGGSRSLYKQVTPTGFLALGARRRWYESTKPRRFASISSSQPSPPNMWLMTGARSLRYACQSANPYETSALTELSRRSRGIPFISERLSDSWAISIYE